MLTRTWRSSLSLPAASLTAVKFKDLVCTADEKPMLLVTYTLVIKSHAQLIF
jgi:hypothetical protein